MHYLNAVAHGAVPVLLTPFTDDGYIDFDAVDELVDFYIDAGVSGLFADCLSGEVFHLTTDERLELARHVATRARGRIAIVAGGNFSGSLRQQAVELEATYREGADVAVVLVSNLPEPEDFIGQLLRLAELTSVPLGLYECPHPVHRMLNDQQVATLAKSGRFVFMKDTTNDVNMCVKKVQVAASSPLRIFEANIRYTPQTLQAGGCGHCGVIANPCPELCAAYCDPAITDETYRQKLYSSMMQIHDVMTSNNYPASAKYILQRRGLSISTETRSNAQLDFTAEHRRNLDACLDGFEFIQTPA